VVDALLQALEIDLAAGLEVRDATQVTESTPLGGTPLLILNLRPEGAAALRRLLLGRYPAEHPVKAWVGGAVCAFRLDELAREQWADYPTSLYLAPAAVSQASGWPLDPLVDVMTRLRAPDGCPWDREQSHQTLRRYLLEEAYEAVEAVDEGDPAHLCEELGDVLLQVVFHAQIAREAGHFDMRTVVNGITAKLIRRHPHVFGDAVAETAADVTRNWEAIKRAERGNPRPESVLSGVSKGLPALTRAEKVQKRAAKVGFDWADAQGPAAKVREELDEVLAAEPADQEGELGDLLFAVVNLARKLKIDPELALGRASAKFERRFRYIEEQAAVSGRSLTVIGLAEMDRLWEESKRAEFGKKYGEK